LHDAGYYTALVGKNHMKVEKLESAASGPSRAAALWDFESHGATPDNSGLESKWVETLQNRPKEKPFFLWLASADAHRGWDGDLQWKESLYGPKYRPEDVRVPPFLVDDEATRKDLASYYNEITRFDFYVGATVRALEQEGLLENTLILVLADNGSPFPRAKTRLHDSGMKTALIAHWPARIAAPGTVSHSLVSSIDLAPTLVEAAGAPALSTAQGVSLMPTFANPEASIRSHAFSEHNWHDYEAHGRCVRSEGYLYIRNHRPRKPWNGPADSVSSPSHQSLLAARAAGPLSPAQSDVFLSPRPTEELYLTATDPLQIDNLAADPAHAHVRARLSKLLEDWMQQTGDAVPEELSPDGYDRQTGQPLRKGPPIRGTWPGRPRAAHLIHEPGPR
jgi:arylsulfatase A-like enzyme